LVNIHDELLHKFGHLRPENEEFHWFSTPILGSDGIQGISITSGGLG